MPPDLPDDIWLYIIDMCPLDYCADNRSFLNNLALACRRLHQIAIPFIYRSLSFRVDFEDEDDPYEQPDRAMVGLIHDLIRAKSLLQSHHLLQHVQQLTLYGWDIYELRETMSAEYFFPEDDLTNGVDTLDAQNMILAIYGVITRLVLHMPQLQRLELLQCHITPMLYAAMSSRPRLTSFYFGLDRVAELHEQTRPINLPITLHIRQIRDHSRWTKEYLSRILGAWIMNLDTLAITSTHLPLVTSHIRNRILPLKILLAQFHHWNLPASDDIIFALWDILRAAPELQTLLIHGKGLEVPPPDDLCNHLCNLFQICASPMTIRKLAEGKELQAVEINKPCHITGLSIVQIVPCSPNHLREITLNAVMPKTQQELDKFIGSFHVFKYLEYLNINHQFPESPATDTDFHESWKVLKNLWRGLKHLRRFNLRSYNLSEYPKEELYGIEAAFPLDMDGEFLSRGHPTLERIGVSFLRRTLWEWVPEHGWVSSRWSYTGWHDENYTSWNRV